MPCMSTSVTARGLLALAGMGGRYLATREAVRPLCVITTINPALIFSAVLQEQGRGHQGEGDLHGGRKEKLQWACSSVQALQASEGLWQLAIFLQGLARVQSGRDALGGSCHEPP
jgi:hypothetical protein